MFERVEICQQQFSESPWLLGCSGKREFSSGERCVGWFIYSGRSQKQITLYLSLMPGPGQVEACLARPRSDPLECASEPISAG